MKKQSFLMNNTQFSLKNYQKTGKNRLFQVDFSTKTAVFRLKNGLKAI